MIPGHNLETTFTLFGLLKLRCLPSGSKKRRKPDSHLPTGLPGLDFVFANTGDVLIASKDEDEHIRHPKEVYKQIQTGDISVKSLKNNFCAPSLSFLGHPSDSQDIAPLPQEVSMISYYPLPESK
ncbi:unnamed protein product [Fasciola hepatica]|uniref:Uncharacterized protein n=1 Tax=Fasciola hepatica TaxID=6192 RepID=A0ABC9HHA5_FASHE|nr:unnamed protein product [Fasciola hepatica]CAK6928153.1 unnamed protein product [Fasciola hepatica]